MGSCACWPNGIKEIVPTPQGIKLMQTAPAVQIPSMHPRVYVLAEKVFANKADTIDSVDLKEREIGEDGGRYLSAILPYLKNVILMNLQFTNISSNAWEQIFQGLGEISSLKHLDVSRNIISEKNIQFLSVSIEKHLNLEAFIIDNTTLTSTGMLELSKSLIFLTKLKILSLSNNTIGDMGLVSLSNSLSLLPDLQFLDISHNSLTLSSIPYLSLVLPHLPQLKVLKIGENHIKDEGLLLITPVLGTNIEEIGLNSIGLSAKGLNELCLILPNWPKLTYLYLDYNHIDQKSMKTLIDILPNLNIKHLSLVGCDVSNHRKALSLAQLCTEVLI
jgi:Ran GTPase-activating protein (RanGAP) involved in mRNA processing and transport